MAQQEKQVTYQATNSYTTLNALTDKTKNIWIVFHGIGYLSKYFLKYFDKLPAEENHIIAPQAPSKYYLNNQYRHVGASWLTKENTANETQNVLNYLDAVYTAINIPAHCKLIVFWLLTRGFDCNKMGNKKKTEVQSIGAICRWSSKGIDFKGFQFLN